MKLFATFFLAAMLAACASPAPQPAPVTEAGSKSVETHDARTFFETTSYAMASSSGYAFSPDGSQLLISSDASGVFNAYALPNDGGDAVMLTSSDSDAVFAESWFPDDRRIIFSRDEGGNELDHVYVRETDGTVVDVTPGEQVKASFVGWAPDGNRFYVTTNERDAKYFDLYTVPVTNYDKTRVYENDEGLALGAVSADGRWVALAKPRTSADSDIYLVDLQSDNRTPRLLTEHEGNIAHGIYDFTPDSQRLIYSTNEYGEFAQAWEYNLSSGEKSPLVAADWDVSYVTYSPSGRYRVHAVNADASTQVTIVDTRTGRSIAMPDLPAGDLSNIRFNPDEDQMALRVSSDTSPGDIYWLDLRDNQPRRLTRALNPDIDEADLVESQVVRYESFDGLEIPGILYRPHGASQANPAPALVWVHGGPGGQSRQGYRAAIQHLVNHGYVVLAANNRGSSGYGKTFFHMDDRQHGEVDLQDIVYARHYLADQDWVDGDRIGIIGGSYGGYMVAAALAFEPDVFDAGIDIFGVTNWVRTLKSIPPWWESFKESLYDEMGDPATDEERHRRISPLFHADQIEKPLLVVQGANDPRVLQVESDELVEAVRANNVPVEYVIFDDEGHGFLKRENRITASEAYLKFLNEYL